MSVNKEAVQRALAEMLRPEHVVEVRDSGGKVLVKLSAPVPQAQRAAFAERVKEKVRPLEGVRDVFVSFAETAPPQKAAPPPAPEPLPGLGRIVAVGAGKGGVGKSTVAVNLAVALARDGLRVGLLDADVYGPSAAIMTGTADHRAQGDARKRVIPAVSFGVKVISIAFLLPKDQTAVVWRGPMVGRMVQQLLTQVAWGDLDLLVVDLPPGTGDAALSLSQTVPLDGALVVTTPQDVALLDVLKAVEMFRSVQVPVAGIVENMAGFTCPHCGKVTEIFLRGGGEKAARRLDVPLLARLPLDPEVPPGGDQGRPIVVEKPKSPTSRAFFDLASRLRSRLDELGAETHAPRVDLGWS